MKQKNYNVIGVMSGTSLDGVDCAFVKIVLEASQELSTYPNVRSEIVMAETVTYTQGWRKRLENAHQLNDNDLQSLNEEYTKYLSNIIKFTNSVLKSY